MTKKQQIREGILDLINSKTETSIHYLQERLDKRKSVDGDVLFSEVMEELHHLDLKKMVKYIGFGIYTLTDKGKAEANYNG